LRSKDALTDETVPSKFLQDYKETTKGILNNKVLSSPTNIRGGENQDREIPSVEIEESKIEQNFNIPEEGRKVKELHGITKDKSVEKNQPLQIDPNKLLYVQWVDRSKFDTPEELFLEFKKWWVVTKNQGETTVYIHIIKLRRMKNHPIFPVNWFNFEDNLENLINQLLYLTKVEYKKIGEVTGNKDYGRYEVDNLLRAINTFGEACNIHNVRKTITPYLGLRKKPGPRPKKVPMPPTVNKLIHYKYFKDPVKNAFLRTLLTVGFHIGARPKELIIIKVSDIDFEECKVTKREEKTGNPYHTVKVDRPIMYSHQQNSLKNWITIHRPRIMKKFGLTEEDVGGLLFLNPDDGRPFSNSYKLWYYCAKHVKPVWKHFTPKIMRDWCAIATLIRYKERNRVWDLREVKIRLGHDRQGNVSEDYIKNAEEYWEDHKYDWFLAVLKFHPNSKRMKRLMKEDYRQGQKVPQKLTNDKNTPPGIISTGEPFTEHLKLLNIFLLLESATNDRLDCLLIIQHYTLNPSFFFYFCLLAASYLSIFEAFLDGGNAMVVRNDHAQPPNYDNKRYFALLQIWLTCWLTSICTINIGGLCGAEAKN